MQIVLHVLSHLTFTVLAWGGCSQLCLSPSLLPALLPQRIANQMLFLITSLAVRELFWPRRHRGKSAKGILGRHFLFLEGRGSFLGGFLFLIPLPALTASNLKLGLESVRMSCPRHCCRFNRGRKIKEGTEDLQASHQEAAGAARELLTFTCRLFPAWTGDAFMDWAKVSWLFSHLKPLSPWLIQWAGLVSFHKWLETHRKMNILRLPREQRAEPWLYHIDSEQKHHLFQFPESKCSGPALCSLILS